VNARQKQPWQAWPPGSHSCTTRKVRHKRAPVQVHVAKPSLRFRHRDDFCVTRDIAVPRYAVRCLGDDFAVSGNHRAKWIFALRGGFRCQPQAPPHHLLVKRLRDRLPRRRVVCIVVYSVKEISHLSSSSLVWRRLIELLQAKNSWSSWTEV
jgi:hypothetical protein